MREKLTDGKDSGVSLRELRNLLKDAYKGFKEGFREAVKTIRHSGNMNGELKAKLKETKQQVRGGFRELRKEFLLRKSEQSYSTQSKEVLTQSTTSNSKNTGLDVKESTTVVTSQQSSVVTTSSESKQAAAPVKTKSTPAAPSAEAPNAEPSFNLSAAISNRNVYSQLQNLTESVSANYDRSQAALVELISRTKAISKPGDCPAG